MLRNKISALFLHSGFQRYLKNTSWLFSGQFLRLFIGLFVSVAVARYLGPEDFGLFNFVISILALLGVVAKLGLPNLLKREMVRFPEKRDRYLGTNFVLTGFAGLLAYCLLLVGLRLSGAQAELFTLAAVMGGSLLINSLAATEVWFQSQVKAKLSVLASSITVVVFAVLKVSALMLGYGLLTFAYLFLLEAIVLECIKLYFYRKHFGKITAWCFDWTESSALLKQCWPLLFSGLAIMVYMRIDQVMLGIMVGEAEVGQYAVATRLSNVAHFVPMLLAASLFPAIVNAKKTDEKLYQNRLRQYFELNTGLAYLIMLPMVFLAPWLVVGLFGSAYQDAVLILQIHVFSLIFVFLGVARGQYLTTEGLFKFSMVSTLVGCFMNLGLNFILIPKYSGLGAAVATVFSQMVAAYLLTASSRKTVVIFQTQTKSLFIPFTIFQRLRSKRI